MGTPSAPGARPSEARDRIVGVEEALPPGEALLWEGRPDLGGMAFRVLHLRTALVYWALVAAGILAFGALGGRASGDLAADLAWLLLVAAAGTGILFALAAAIRKSSTYALTERRVVIRMGVAFPSVLNLPLDRIASVDVRVTGRDADGREVGDLVLTPAGEDRVGWLYLWPHNRPWAFRDPLPAFRALADVVEVGRRVAEEVAKATAEKGSGPAAGEVRSPASSEDPDGEVAA
jgi:hypothetical protein